MLAAIAYEQNNESLLLIEEVLYKLRGGIRTKVCTPDANEAKRYIADERGVFLFLGGIQSHDEHDAGLLLARYAQSSNRQSDIVLILPALDALDQALDGNIRVAGVLVRPFTQIRAASLVKRIATLHNSEGVDDEQCVVFQSGSSHIRIPTRGILYIEAQGKKLNVWTRKQCVSVYGTLTQLETSLQEGFMRCHRAYIVRQAAIQSVSFAQMEMTLRGGARVPIARSHKSQLKKWLGDHLEVNADE